MLGQERDSSCGATRLDIIKMPAYARTTERARSASEGQFSLILPYCLSTAGSSLACSLKDLLPLRHRLCG